MRIVGPQAFTVGASTPVIDPASAGGNPSVACQIQNSSPYQLLINAGNGILSLQPFTAQTIEIANQPLTIDPESGTGTGTCTITLAFLLATAQGDGEQLPDGTWIEDPPMTDGPLTAAAITAAITGALGTQGVVDLIFAPAGVSFTNGTPVGLSGQIAAHNYSTLLVSFAGLGTPGAVISCQAFRTATGVATIQSLFPSQTQSFGTDPLAPANSSLTFALLCDFQVGDQVNLLFEINGAGSGIVDIAIYGLTAENTQQVITPVGMPLGTYQVGGAKTATTTLLANTLKVILAAPPAGFGYRLQRFTAPSGNTILNGTTSNNTYGSAGPGNNSVDNLDGLIVNEGLSGFGAAGAVFLFYDVIPVQTLQ